MKTILGQKRAVNKLRRALSAPMSCANKIKANQAYHAAVAQLESMKFTAILRTLDETTLLGFRP